MAHTFIPALGRQRQTNLCEFEANLVYRVLGQPELNRETLSQKKIIMRERERETMHPTLTSELHMHIHMCAHIDTSKHTHDI